MAQMGKEMSRMKSGYRCGLKCGVDEKQIRVKAKLKRGAE